MKHIALGLVSLILLGCGQKFEPELKGWRAYAVPARAFVLFDIDGHSSRISLPSKDGVAYRFPQWTKSGDRILLMQSVRQEKCSDFRLISVDTSGNEIDTIYTPPPGTALNFKLAPNDTLVLIKTYEDCAGEEARFRYTFYNRFTGKWLPDTVTVRNARGVPIHETVWSPDSRRVIVTQWAGRREDAFVYSLDSRDTTYIGKGTNFVWSPVDNNMVAYIKEYSVYTLNLQTGEEELIFEGKRKRRVVRFRFDPTGEFLMMYVRRYFLNIEAGPTGNESVLYVSLKDKVESKYHWGEMRLDSWIKVHSP